MAGKCKLHKEKLQESNSQPSCCEASVLLATVPPCYQWHIPTLQKYQYISKSSNHPEDGLTGSSTKKRRKREPSHCGPVMMRPSGKVSPPATSAATEISALYIFHFFIIIIFAHLGTWWSWATKNFLWLLALSLGQPSRPRPQKGCNHLEKQYLRGPEGGALGSSLRMWCHKGVLTYISKSCASLFVLASRWSEKHTYVQSFSFSLCSAKLPAVISVSVLRLVFNFYFPLLLLLPLWLCYDNGSQAFYRVALFIISFHFLPFYPISGFTLPRYRLPQLRSPGFFLLWCEKKEALSDTATPTYAVELVAPWWNGGAEFYFHIF